MDMKERMHQELLYLPDDEELWRSRFAARSFCTIITGRGRPRRRSGTVFLKVFCRAGGKLLCGTAASIQLRGKFVHFGKNIYANYNLRWWMILHIDGKGRRPFLDLATGILKPAGHPVDPELRKKNLQFNSIHIGKNCWIGAGAILLPGVSIGGKFCDRGRKRSDEGYSRQCGGGGESLPGSQKDWGEGPGVLFP